MICLGGLSLDPRSALLAGLGLALPLALVGLQPAFAQPEQPTQNDKAEKLKALEQHDQELKATQEQQRKSADNEAALKREIEKIGADRRKLSQALIDTAAKLRDVEAKVEATQARLAPLDAKEHRIRKSLQSRRAVIGEVLAALQRIGHHAPPALISGPEDALKAVRTAMVLDAVLPAMRRQVAALVNDLEELVNLRKKIAAQRDLLKKQVASLGAERARVRALVAERQKQQIEREKALEAERAHAADLAKKANNLRDLIAKLEQSLPPATREGREKAIQRTPREALAALHDPGRLAPAVAFASLRGRIPIPVNGVKLKDFGSPDGVGGHEKGVSIATRAGAQVTSPADGWVVYAGPFRSYGQLLILDPGGGYHILLAGMARISVDLGQFVLTGEPVAVMGNGSHVAAILATGSSQPVLYIEFRKDGAPVDPGPWWAAGEGEKARG
ncbi:MAG: peptidoglycan DD-metalloendopeptidase family protein [Pseudolabrys sp.]